MKITKEFRTTPQLNYVCQSANVKTNSLNFRGWYLECGNPGSEHELSQSSGCNWQKTAHWSGQKPGTAMTAHPTKEGKVMGGDEVGRVV